MKNKYGLLFALFILFISGIMNAQIKADFGVKITGPKVDFTNSTTSNPTISSFFYRWDFGDGSGYHYTYSTASYRHKFLQLGNFKVTLIAIDTTGTLPADTFLK